MLCSITVGLILVLIPNKLILLMTNRIIAVCVSLCVSELCVPVC
jgi:hypothetical protein